MESSSGPEPTSCSVIGITQVRAHRVVDLNHLLYKNFRTIASPKSLRYSIGKSSNACHCVNTSLTTSFMYVLSFFLKGLRDISRVMCETCIFQLKDPWYLKTVCACINPGNREYLTGIFWLLSSFDKKHYLLLPYIRPDRKLFCCQVRCKYKIISF